MSGRESVVRGNVREGKCPVDVREGKCSVEFPRGKISRECPGGEMFGGMSWRVTVQGNFRERKFLGNVWGNVREGHIRGCPGGEMSGGMSGKVQFSNF